MITADSPEKCPAAKAEAHSNWGENTIIDHYKLELSHMACTDLVLSVSMSRRGSLDCTFPAARLAQCGCGWATGVLPSSVLAIFENPSSSPVDRGTMSFV